MTYKVVPDEDAHKLSADEIVGRRVVHSGSIKGLGTVISVNPAFLDRCVVNVRWEGSQGQMAHAWGHAGGFQIKLVAEEPTEASETEEVVVREIMPRETSHKLHGDMLVGMRVVRGPDWNPMESSYDDGGKLAGTIRSINSTGHVVYVEWDGKDKTAGHYFGGCDKYEVDILTTEGTKTVSKLKVEEIRPYDPSSKWERPNILVLAMFASEFEEVRKTI